MRAAASSIVLSALLVAGLAAQTTGIGSVTGRVVDPTGTPLPGATVTLTGDGAGASTISDVEGRFVVEGFVNTSSVSTVTASLAGFQPANRKIRVVPGGTVTAGDIALPLGCAEIDLVIVGSLAERVEQAAAVAHVRIESMAAAREWRLAHGCVMAREVTASVQATLRGRARPSLRFLIKSRTPTDDKPGDEMVVFLDRDASSGLYTSWAPGLPVSQGVATVDNAGDVPGFDREVPVTVLFQRLSSTK